MSSAVSETPRHLEHFGTKWPEMYKSEFQYEYHKCNPSDNDVEIADGTVTRKEWDDIFLDYNASMDFPTCMFPRSSLFIDPLVKCHAN